MSYVNVGANDSKGKRVPTKAKLKELVRTAQELEADEVVFFDQTSIVHDGGLPGTITLNDLKPGTVLVVVGPDPYTRRNWYANVERKNGKVKVS
jgi:hypothetical protein